MARVRHRWRYTLIEYDGKGGNAIVTPDLILTGVTVRVALTGTDSFSATVPVYHRQYVERGVPIFRRWSTAVVVERDGMIVTVALISDVDETADSLSLTGVGVAGWPAGQPYRGDRVWNQDDAGLIFKHVWDHVQSWPGCNLGVRVPEFVSGRKVGWLPRTPRVLTKDAEAKVAAAKAAKDRAYAYYRAARPETPAEKDADAKVAAADAAKDKALAEYRAAKAALAKASKGSAAVKAAAAARVVAAKKAYNAARAAYDAAKVARARIDKAQSATVKARKAAYDRLNAAYKAAVAQLAAAKAAQAKEAASTTAANKAMEAAGWQQYRYSWWDNVDVGSKLDELATLGAFDYVAEHAWSGDQVVSSLRVMTRASARRNDAYLVVGENIISDVTVRRDGARYATDVLVTGAGEGAAMVSASSHHPQGVVGVSRWRQVTDKTITSRPVAQARADAEARASLDPVTLSELVCIDHPGAPFGSIRPGDWVFPRGSGRGYTAVLDRWCRVVGITYDPAKDLAKLTVIT